MTRTLTRLAIASGLLILSATGVAQERNILFLLDGEGHNDLLGISMDGLGDLDGDSRPDMVVGASDHDRRRGQAKVVSCGKGTAIFTFVGDDPGDRFGCAVANAGDVNADGLDDIVVGAAHDDDRGESSGSAKVFSGKDGSVLYTFHGDSPFDEFGNAVAGAGDVNRDGFADILVGAYLDDSRGTDSGSVFLYSGRNGSLIRRFRGNQPHDWFGYSVAGIGDVNGDGRDDVFVGACYEDATAFNSGTAHIYSGRNGALLRTFAGQAKSDWFGTSVAGAGDIDSDGTPDVIVGASFAGSGDRGTATVFSGRNGNVLHHFTGQLPGDEFGVSVRGCGDADGDGRPDIVVGAYHGSTLHAIGGSVYVFSGRDGSTLATFQGTAPNDRFGITVTGVGDVNGDGRAEIVAGAVYDDNNGSNSGSACLLSVVDLALVSDRPTASIAHADPQELDLDAGAQHANLSYWILGSASGTRPGIPIGGFELPLHRDGYTDFTIEQTNSATLARFAGRLDADGKATATFQLTGGSSSLIGLTLHHAFFVYDSGSNVRMVSNPVPLTFVQ